MNDGLTISVCVATYNGEKYIREQLDSILATLNDGDEIVVSDDGSSDGTMDILRGYEENHPLRVVMGPRDGFSSNFGNAIAQARGDIVVFSDQDDIWAPNKLQVVREAFRDGQLTTLLHNMATFRNNTLQDTAEIPMGYHAGVMRNFIKSSYWGCCMAVKRDFVRRFFPFRPHCVGHDQLIGLMSEAYGKTAYIDQKLIWHRLHQTNTSNHRTIKQMIDFRIELEKDYRFAKSKYLQGVRRK